jgi:thioredoxin 1
MSEPTRQEIDRQHGLVVLEFGASWCGWCEAARPLVDQVFAQHPDVHVLWIEDGRGKPLGRSFGVKLWPTLVFLRDGREVARVVRPRSERELRDALAKMMSAAA